MALPVVLLSNVLTLRALTASTGSARKRLDLDFYAAGEHYRCHGIYMSQGEAFDDLSDWDCVRHVQKGETNAFEPLVRRHQKTIYNLVYRMLGGNSEKAAEAAHEVFILAFKAVLTFRGNSSFKTWIYQIAINHAKSARMKLAKENKVFKESADDTEITSADIVRTDTPEDSLAKKEFWAYLQNALNRLSPEHCEIIVLITIQGESYEDTAAVLDIPINTVKSRLNRAREALARECAPLLRGWN